MSDARVNEEQLLALLQRSVRLEQLAREQHRRLIEQRVLLRSALHELATTKGVEPGTFYARWLRDHMDSTLRPREGGGWR